MYINNNKITVKIDGFISFSNGKVKDCFLLKKINLICVHRWCHAPFFADVAKGAFVRINIGQNDGTPVYRVRIMIIL
jgi:hypothetical protein